MEDIFQEGGIKLFPFYILLLYAIASVELRMSQIDWFIDWSLVNKFISLWFETEICFEYNPVILQSCDPVILSFSHSAILSSCHPVNL